MKVGEIIVRLTKTKHEIVTDASFAKERRDRSFPNPEGEHITYGPGEPIYDNYIKDLMERAKNTKIESHHLPKRKWKFW